MLLSLSQNCDYHANLNVNISPCVDNHFSIFHNNIRSLPAHFDDFQIYLVSRNFNFTVIGISETWFKYVNNSTLYNIDGYNLVRVDRPDNAGGGVCLYVKNNIPFIVLDDLSFSSEQDFESLFIEINCDHFSTKVIVGIMYCPHGIGSISSFEKISCIFEKTSSYNFPCFIMGDFNIDLCKVAQDTRSTDFLNLLLSCSFYPLIYRPTRATDSSMTLIDILFLQINQNFIP